MSDLFVDPATGLPACDHYTGYRVMGLLPTPKNHRLRSAPGWLQVTGIEPIPRSDWSSYYFRRPRKNVPIYDQGSRGKCVSSSTSRAMMVIRDRAGFPFELLSDDEFYTFINGGVDEGANLGDAVDAAVAHGIAPQSAVSSTALGPPGYDDRARQAGMRFRLRGGGGIPLKTVDEVFTASVLGYEVIFAVEAGEAYVTDQRGVVAYLGTGLNHAQHCGEGVWADAAGDVYFDGANSWGTSFGIGGRCSYTTQHLQSSIDQGSTFALTHPLADPDDPHAVPGGLGPLTPGPLPTPTPSPTPVPGPTVNDPVALMNAQRASHGLPPLVNDPRLTTAAQGWASTMARMGFLSHTGFAGRMKAVYPGKAAAENVGYGVKDAASVVAGWMGSPQHRANVLGPYTHAGVGMATGPGGGLFWCADFAKL